MVRVGLRAAGLAAILVRPSLAAAAAAAEAIDAETLAAMAVGDECRAGRAGGADACALSALQHRTSAAQSVAANATEQRRLTIVNGCASRPIWIAHIAAGRVGPDPQDLKLEPGASHAFQTSENGRGLVATRYWPKLGCDPAGNNCAVGDSGGPGEGCVIRSPNAPDDYSRCAPPTDSKFEATFAPPDAPTRDTVDMSLVDGYSLPFKLEVQGDCTRVGRPFHAMECQGLSLRHCPRAEMLNGRRMNLHATNPKTGRVAGCYSPCMRLTDDKWGRPYGGPDSPAAAPFCCAGSHGTPGVCSRGPAVRTQYLRAVHRSCPAAYGYAYDDKSATIVCTTSTRYTVTFYCPDVPA